MDRMHEDSLNKFVFETYFESVDRSPNLVTLRNYEILTLQLVTGLQNEEQRQNHCLKERGRADSKVQDACGRHFSNVLSLIRLALWLVISVF